MNFKQFHLPILVGSMVVAASGTRAITDPALVEIKVEVQEIAVLTIVESSASTIMIDPHPTSVGALSQFGPPTGTAELELYTNFCVGLQVDFATVTGIRPNPNRFYGQALGLGNGNTLGVMPYFFVDSVQRRFGGKFPLLGSGSDAPLGLSASSGGLCNGFYDIYIGAVTQWDLTLQNEPLYAAPDTYRIPITVSLVP